MIDDGKYLEPGEDYKRHFLVHVPFEPEFRGARSTLHLSVQLFVAKRQRLELADQESHGPEHVRRAVESDYEKCHPDAGVPNNYVLTEWPIQRLSRIRELTAGRQAVNIILVLRTRARPDGSTVLVENPWLTLCVDRVGRFEHASENAPIRNDPTRVCPGLLDIARQPDYDRRMQGFYGIVATSAMNEVALPPS